jgi:hypothetical protein
MEPDTLERLSEAVTAFFALIAGPPALGSGLRAWWEWRQAGPNLDERISVALNRGIARAFPLGLGFGLVAYAYELYKVA